MFQFPFSRFAHIVLRIFTPSITDVFSSLAFIIVFIWRYYFNSTK